MMANSESSLRDSLAQIILLVPPENVSLLEGQFCEVTTHLLEGQFPLIINAYSEVLSDPKIGDELQSYGKEEGKSSKYIVLQQLKLFVKRILEGFQSKYGPEDSKVHLHFVAIAFLQLFVQCNFTGPEIADKLIIDFDSKALHRDLVDLLSLSGQQCYELVNSPLYLVVSQLIFESLLQVPESSSLYFDSLDIIAVETLSEYYLSIKTPNSAVDASIHWWFVRSLQVRASLLNEPESLLPTVSSILLNSSLPNLLCPSSNALNEDIQKSIQIIFYLESARLNIQAQTEHLALPFLNKAKDISQFEFVLSGAKAKRTKFQKFYASALVVLAKSNQDNLFNLGDGQAPESFELNSDLLLEKPEFSTLEDIEESDAKRIKLDYSGGEDVGDQRLLPIAIRKDNIPTNLQNLDPNDQPSLSDLDTIQLLLRLTTIKQTTPFGDTLVEEELLAVVSRILYSAKNTNWSIFSRSLWERSILETSKARTIERGILQMTSLVEELGVKIKTRIIPEAEEAKNVLGARLRFIHQLPLLSQWQMDIKLAEKYMSIGVLRSAVEIYERLELIADAALCYAAVGEEKTAENLLLKRIETHPNDARAISILGDIRQDPELWLKAWEVGKYSNAQASLSKYFYGQKKLDLAIKHMNICLNANPINYENWYFYGCCGLESEQYNLASEAFSRCVSLDDTNSHAWSNLALALLQTDKVRPAFNALQKAIRVAGETKSWRIYENYLIVAAKLGEWNDVLIAARELISIKRDGSSEGTIDLPVVEKLAEILVATEFPSGENARMTHYQKSCVEFICNDLPKVNTTSARCWRVVAKVEIWRKRPWAALENYEKAFRALSHKPEMATDEEAWNEAVEGCSDLVSAYETLGELPGKHGADDLVCKDWKYKARSTIRSLMSKGKAMWEDSTGWDQLQEMKEDLKG